MNQLATDSLYDANPGSEPARNQEVLQSWEAVRELNARLVAKASPDVLQPCRDAVRRAMTNYDVVKGLVRMDPKSDGDHVQPLAEGLELFAKLAEL